MYRFPNPGSDINVLVSIYEIIQDYFSDKYYFNIDDMSGALVRSGAITSSGSVGEEALMRSYNKKRSIDPVYNQVKMYAEIFRKLGFISSYLSQLNYVNTDLGKSIVRSERNIQKDIIRNCLLGIVSPNENINDKSNIRIRPFKDILLASFESQNKINKAEVIVILSNQSDTEQNYLSRIADKIKEMRSGKEKTYLEEISIQRKISTVTMGNYTRFPLGAMLWSEWFEKKNNYFHLTNLGKRYAEKIRKSKDLRDNDLENYKRSQLIKYGNDFLFHNKNEYLFSHFQQLNIQKIDSKKRKEYLFKNQFKTKDKEKDKITYIKLFRSSNKIKNDSKIEISFDEIASYKQIQFYPFTVRILKDIGFDAEVSRVGINNNRTDALIKYDGNFIPIEIKSPTEEKTISPKAVRQAIENKIILLNRKIFPTTIDYSTFVVGFDVPNKRSEIHELIASAYKYFKIKINLISIKTLIEISNGIKENNYKIDKDDLLKSYGISKIIKKQLISK